MICGPMYFQFSAHQSLIFELLFTLLCTEWFRGFFGPTIVGKLFIGLALVGKGYWV
jgi:hypothetical protein